MGTETKEKHVLQKAQNKIKEINTNNVNVNRLT